MASYELCALAVVAFIIDHVGFYFFTEQLWFRIFRLFALVWFFPAGYNSAWRSGRKVWAGIFILTVLDAYMYTTFWPICAVLTLVLARVLVDPVMDFALKSSGRFWAAQFVLALLVIPSSEAVEYGTLALMIANAGWLLRHRRRIPEGIVNLPLYFVFVTALYIAFSQYTFTFNDAQLAFVVLSTSGTAWLMYHFDAMIKEDLRRKKEEKDDWVRKATCFLAHRSLEIYVGHLVLFKLIFIYVNK
jgi:hypothetical protein